MNDQVPWGAYIANFTYFVGMGTAPVMVALPALVYRKEALRPVLTYGWPLLLIVLSGVAMAAVVLDLTVFAR